MLFAHTFLMALACNSKMQKKFFDGKNSPNHHRDATALEREKKEVAIQLSLSRLGKCSVAWVLGLDGCGNFWWLVCWVLSQCTQSRARHWALVPPKMRQNHFPVVWRRISENFQVFPLPIGLPNNFFPRKSTSHDSKFDKLIKGFSFTLNWIKERKKSSRETNN